MKYAIMGMFTALYGIGFAYIIYIIIASGGLA